MCFVTSPFCVVIKKFITTDLAVFFNLSKSGLISISSSFVKSIISGSSGLGIRISENVARRCK